MTNDYYAYIELADEVVTLLNKMNALTERTEQSPERDAFRKAVNNVAGSLGYLQEAHIHKKSSLLAEPTKGEK